jgi:hypothetical protein
MRLVKPFKYLSRQTNDAQDRVLAVGNCVYMEETVLDIAYIRKTESQR